MAMRPNFHVPPKSFLAIKKKYDFKCVDCGVSETPENKLTRDHIIPVSRGGSKALENVQPMCRECNLRKGNGFYKQKNPGKPHSRLKKVKEIKDSDGLTKTERFIQYGI